MYTIYDIMKAAHFSNASTKFFDEVYQSICVDHQLYILLHSAKNAYMNKLDPAADLNRLSDAASIHRYSADMLMLLEASCDLADRYLELGYSSDLFYETIQDLGYKLKECLAVYGIHGTFVLPWFDRFYDCTRFKLGRLQYETGILEKDYPGFGKQGDPVINCHIPSGSPLTVEDVKASLSLAYEFYGYKMPMLVRCATWMLYPPHYPLFPEGSNLRKFYDLFEIAETQSYGNNREAWRIFNTADQDITKWPQNTTLQRNFYNYISQGNHMGYGVGFLFYTNSSDNSSYVEKI